MRILLVITKADVGGAQKRVLDLARMYKDAGHGVGVAYGETGPFVSELERENIALWRFKHLKRSYNPLSMLLYIREIRTFLNKMPFDIVHFNSSNALAGALGAKRTRAVPSESEIDRAKRARAVSSESEIDSAKQSKGSTFSKRLNLLTLRRGQNGPKTVFTFRGLSQLDFGSPMPKYQKFVFWCFFKFFLGFIDAPVFQCERNLHHAKRMFLVRHGEVIYPGIDPKSIDFLERDTARKYLEMMIGRPLGNFSVIGSIGRLSAEKNYQFLIEAFPKIQKRYKKMLLVIIGDGRERNKLENLIRSLELEEYVYLPGESQDAATVLKAFDLFVLPSHFEGVSVALTEAMFASIPVLASDVGGNKEVVCGNESALYKPDDADDFLEKFENLEHNHEDGSCKEKFLLSKSSKEYLKLYEELLGSRE